MAWSLTSSERSLADLVVEEKNLLVWNRPPAVWSFGPKETRTVITGYSSWLFGHDLGAISPSGTSSSTAFVLNEKLIDNCMQELRGCVDIERNQP